MMKINSLFGNRVAVTRLYSPSELAMRHGESPPAGPESALLEGPDAPKRRKRPRRVESEPATLFPALPGGPPGFSGFGQLARGRVDVIGQPVEKAEEWDTVIGGPDSAPGDMAAVVSKVMEAFARLQFMGHASVALPPLSVGDVILYETQRATILPNYEHQFVVEAGGILGVIAETEPLLPGIEDREGGGNV